MSLSITGERYGKFLLPAILQYSQYVVPSRKLSIYLVITKANKVLSHCVSIYRVIQLELLVQIIISVFLDQTEDIKKSCVVETVTDSSNSETSSYRRNTIQKQFK